MLSLLLVLAVSFLICLLVTPAFRDGCLRLGWVDRPDALRKVHTRAVPRVGGAAILIAFAAALALLAATPLSGAAILKQELQLWRLLPAAAVVFAAGLLDDLVGLKPWQKLLGQLAGAALACWGGIGIRAVSTYELPHWSTVPLTLLWLIACTNAFNLIDGLDGLAAGLGFFATLTMCVGALLQQNFALAIATVPLAGALLGFLRYNLHPATIFLGDCGSQTIGFLLGCYGVIWSQKSTTLFGIAAPVMALSVPLLDTAASIARRFLNGQPVFVADRGHVHHRLLARGLTPRRVTLILYAGSGVGAVLSVLQSVVHQRFDGLIIILFCVAAWAGIQHAGYVEFDEARRMIFGGSLRRLLSARVAMHQFEERLAKAGGVDECWDLISAAGAELGFTHSLLTLDGMVRGHRSEEVSAAECWELRIPLAGSDYAQFFVPFQAPVQVMTVTLFANAVRRDLGSRLQPLPRPELSRRSGDPPLAPARVESLSQVS